MKMRLLALGIVIMLVGCGVVSRLQLRDELNARVGRMTLDEALSRWGRPVDSVEGDAVVVHTWRRESTNPFDPQVTIVDEVILTFDKESRVLRRWSYDRKQRHSFAP